MKREKLILLLIAVIVGLIVAGGAFYLYQSTKEIPGTKIKKISVLEPTPTPKPSVFISLNTPANESVSSKALITVSGKTVPNSRFTIITPVDQSAGISSADGDFSTTVTLDSDQNIVRITVIAPNGETTTLTRTVTYSTENF